MVLFLVIVIDSAYLQEIIWHCLHCFWFWGCVLLQTLRVSYIYFVTKPKVLGWPVLLVIRTQV
jgi:hypothetical protein